MKNLFTLCACALFTITLSAQSEQAAGSYYLGSGDALDLVNIFGGEVDMAVTIGYAVIDDLVVTGSINSNSYMDVAAVAATVDACGVETPGVDATYADEINLNLGFRYFGFSFMNGLFVQANATNLLSAGDLDDGSMSIELGVGKYFSLGAVSDRFYVDPQINYNLDTGFNTMIGLGLRF
jgi:hypothetical protein